MISCKKDFDTSKFPTLYFSQADYNFTFELTEKDLFEVRGDRKYFLIVFKVNTNSHLWKLGRVFMQKYFLNFDYNSKTIGFYKYLYDKKEGTKFNYKAMLWVIWIFLLILTGVGCFFLGKLVYDKTRKKRANELDDDYDYQINKEENEGNQGTGENGEKLGIK